MTKIERLKQGIEIEKFIREYLAENHTADRLNADFHDQFSDKFGGKRIIFAFGSCPNLLAMTWLKNLYSQGILDRRIVPLYHKERGFPNWVYSYTLRGE